MLKNKPTYIFLLSTIIFFFGCASKRAPGGGPIDKVPPEIIATFPKPDSIGIKQLSVIEITFSESIDESSIANSVFISPPLEFKLEWQSDVDLEIQLKDSLKANQTYVIVIGSNVKDLRRNKLTESMQLAFSTGDQIDRGKISGKVYGLKRKETYSLFAFELFSDTISFDKNIPNYISQTGDKGKYLLNYLKMGKYRVFAVNDQNNNLKIDSDFEKIGLPYVDVLLDSTNNTFSDLNFKTTKIDTTAPKLTTIRPISSRQLNLRLSEQITLKSLRQIEIRDSVTAASLDILAASENVESDNTLEIFTSPMDSGKVYFCLLKSFSDSSLNYAADTTQSFIAAGFKAVDTFKVVTVAPKDSVWNAHPTQGFYFETNNPLDKQSIMQNLIVKKQNGDTVKGSFTFPSAYEAEFKPQDDLILDTVYTFQVDYPKVKNVWGDSLQDSILTRHIKINNGDDYGEISGKIRNMELVSPRISVNAKKTASKRDDYSGWASKDNSYILKYIPEGHYLLSSFFDEDSNAVYSAGHLYPFKFSEPFVVSDDTTKVRKRWETSGVDLTIPSSGK